MNYPIQLSIIIPTLNEEANIGKLIKYLKTCYEPGMVEIIVSDGQSTDKTVEEARLAGAKVILCPTRGRGYQMNFGAAIANAPIFYFLHADTYPPQTFVSEIINSVHSRFDLGRYRTKFESTSILLKLNAFFTRFDFVFCYGGDQTLFITKELFQKIHGFASEMKIMEDYDIVKRSRKIGNYKILRNQVRISARKYTSNSWLKVQLANLKIIRMFEKGASQDEMITKYKELIDYR